MATILIGDPDVELRRRCRVWLESAGHMVLEAQDGREVLAWYGQAPTDLLILDLSLLPQDGFDTIAELRRRFPSARTRIITLGDAGSVMGILNLSTVLRMSGAHRTLKKPFALASLSEAVREEINSLACDHARFSRVPDVGSDDN